MSNIVEPSNLFHRTRDRIIELGEVFTPEKYVEKMLDILSRGKRNFWNNENIIFFEPTCGHGNIVIPIYRRRLKAFYKKAIHSDLSFKTNVAPFYAVANSLNTLWAIDIDAKNIENCRSRILSVTMEYLKTKLNIKNETTLLSKNKDFFAHVLTAIKWHIFENETISAMSNPDEASFDVKQTSAGAKWFSANGHRPLDFDLSWANYFQACKATKATPIEFERSIRFIDATLAGRIKGFDDYEYAKAVIEINNSVGSKDKPARPLSVGV